MSDPGDNDNDTVTCKDNGYIHRPFPSVFSNRSFASLILLARYGEPPRSGWFASMICRWASFSLLRSIGPSLSPRMAIASFLSIFARNPPFAHCSAAPLPMSSPRCIIERPRIAAAIALTPRITGVAMKCGTMLPCGRSRICDLHVI